MNCFLFLWVKQYGIVWCGLLMYVQIEEVLDNARKAKAAGSTRFCMGSAWREVGKKHAFGKVIEMVKEVNSMGMEVCCTLGMLTEDQVRFQMCGAFLR